MKKLIVVIVLTLCSSLFAAGSTINEDTIHFIGQASGFSVGSNLVTNGDFAVDSGWTKGTGWTTAGGDADCDGSAAGDTDLTQNITSLTDGRVYRITYEVTAVTAPAVTAVFDGTEIGDKGATAVYTGYLAATGTDADLDIRGDAAFVGSIDNVSVVAWVGSLNAGGGCTIATFSGTLTDYMTATGGLIATEAALATENNGSNKVRIVSGSTWAQTPIAGTLLKIDLSAPLDSGEDDAIYEITAATTTTIDIDANFAAGGADDAITCEIWVGGAYPDIATALNDSTLSQDPDGTYRKRYICVNAHQEVDVVADFVAETSETALLEDDGSRKVIGFYDSISVVQPDAGYRVVSDMDQDGIYYGGAWQAFKSDEGFTDIRPNGKWIEWDANGRTIAILELNTSNFEMRNIKIHDADTVGAGSLFHVDTANFNTTFVNCWFGAAATWQKDDLVATNSSVIDCYFSDVLLEKHFRDFQSSFFTNNIFNGTGLTNTVVAIVSNTFSGCLCYKGSIGFVNFARVANNCVFFGQTDVCMKGDAAAHRVQFYANNIFSPAAASDVAVQVVNGSLSNGFNNIMYSVSAGAVLTNPVVHDQITPNPALPVGTLEVNPQFINPADGDFRPLASSPALNSGMKSVFGGRTSIGAWQPYALPVKSRRPRYTGRLIYK